jgi:Glycosyl hydrolase family 63 C-terminal domain
MAAAEQTRLQEATEKGIPWKKWGPYLSERQWGTVREDYSPSGDAWNYFNHEQSRSRAYRWGEDGLAGVSDAHQHLCFALALWNGRDPILKERLFGLTNGEGNHGEDVKEYYFYLDNTPTHSYMKYLYKYPQAAFPYGDLLAVNRQRSRSEFEYELLDTGIFDEDHYFDVFVEYAKASPEDLLIRITVHNRGPQQSSLDVLPTLWFRNTWSWDQPTARPSLRQRALDQIVAAHAELGELQLCCEGADQLLFTDNDTNNQRLWRTSNKSRFVKDGINDFIVDGRAEAVNPERTGTKAAAHYRLSLGAGASRVLRLRLTAGGSATNIGADFESVMQARRAEADEFYRTVIPANLTADQTNVVRQALAGMLWTKQFYFYNVTRWLSERGTDLHNPVAAPRNGRWQHLYNADILSMPDKWEYPWYAAWDLAFHVLALTLVDAQFGKHQIDLILEAAYLHPNGQVPAYEWNFGDVNPPVHAWSTIFTYRLEQAQRGSADVEWLERSFHKLSLNFTWWVNRKDRAGDNAFEGGFLGLDNIGVFDRSAPLPTGGYLEQADGTAWMALFCQNMIEISGELALHDPSYTDMWLKYIEHYLWIASALMHIGHRGGMWDEEDGFFYDVLRLPDGRSERLKIRSMVGLLPLCAVTSFEGETARRYPLVAQRAKYFLDERPELRSFIHDPAKLGPTGRTLASVLNEARLRRILSRMLDEREFLSPYGIRSLSRAHQEHPYAFWVGGEDYRVDYAPAESTSGMFGGNSNWRGPIWMPVNALLIRALLQYYLFYGDSFTVECPTGSGRQMTLYEVAAEIARRLESIFLRDESAGGRRPVYGGTRKFQEDRHWRDYILFYEYFHGDNGAGLGASHQTGWTGIIARVMQIFATIPAEQLMHRGKDILRTAGRAESKTQGAPTRRTAS